jgi:hypothetical protein
VTARAASLAEGRAALPDRLRELRRAAADAPDLAAFCALVLLTTVFGRPFSKVGVGGALYVTEAAIVVVAVLAVVRVGLRGAWERIRRAVPLVPLGLLWLAGAVAAVRGLADYGASSTIRDIGLAEYSVFVPLVAVLVDTAGKGRFFLRFLAVAGGAAGAAYAVVLFLANESALGPRQNPTSAVGLYLALLILPVAALLAHRRAVPRWVVAAAAACLLLTALGSARSVLLALLVSLVVLAVLSPRPLVVGTAALGAAGAALVLALGLQSQDIGNPAPALSPVQEIRIGGVFLAGDDVAPFDGGTVVSDDAARGELARRVARAEALTIPLLGGLVPGADYTVSFAVRPGGAAGLAGDPSRAGWSAEEWSAKAAPGWTRASVRLRATRPVEYLQIVAERGPASLLVDDVRVVRAGAGATAATQGEAIERESGTALGTNIGDSFDPTAASGNYENMSWRLAFWRYLARETLANPVLGRGFGRPAAFAWDDKVYDTRVAGDLLEVSPPHNSFVNLLYRTGLVGLLGALALVAIGVVRTWRLRRTAAPADRPWLTALLALLAYALVIANLNVALEGPFMGLVFWTLVGLLLVLPKVFQDADERPENS